MVVSSYKEYERLIFREGERKEKIRNQRADSESSEAVG